MTIKHKGNVLHRKSEEGFVILTALMIAFLVVSIVASVALVTMSDLGSNAKQRKAVESRFAGESFSDDVFSALAGLTDLRNLVGINGFLRSSGRLCMPPGGVPCSETLFEFFEDSSHWDDPNEWYYVDDDGSLRQCQNNAEDFARSCFKARLEHKGNELVLTVVVRSNCNPSGNNCIYRKFEQRYRIREFLNNVMLVNTSTDSETNMGVAFLPDDVIGGAHHGVHSNDDLVYCGDGGPLQTANNGSTYSNSTRNYPTATPPSIMFCNSTTPPSVSHLSRQFIVGQLNQTGANTNTGSVFASITANTPYSFAGPTTIELDDDEVIVNGNYLAWPSRGVIYVAGRVDILASAYSRPLTIFATDGVRIMGNITRPATSLPSVLLGIGTSQNIDLYCGNNTECDTREIYAVLSAPQGRIRNDRWSNSLIDNIGPRPVFILVGSIVAQEQPVFGAYTSVSGQELVHGWKKDLRFDTNLIYNQPPYFFRTTQSNVARSSIDEGPCTYSFCN